MTTSISLRATNVSKLTYITPVSFLVVPVSNVAELLSVSPPFHLPMFE
jgi:hypothetical protein